MIPWYCIEKYNKNDRSPLSLRRYDGPILSLLCLITPVISSVHATFCGGWKQRLLKCLVGRKYRPHETMQCIIYLEITQLHKVARTQNFPRNIVFEVIILIDLAGSISCVIKEGQNDVNCHTTSFSASLKRVR